VPLGERALSTVPNEIAHCGYFTESDWVSSKPTIFFSHSSNDKVFVARLKQMFIAKTHGTIDVFVSSDGQSIRLGKNWVHEVEEALKRASIMFVFLTPDSIKSGWIYFESGYCHSKGIEVIPVALDGIDLNKVRAPLSLLQGFNLISAGSLNNLISTANLKFGTSHPESFSDNEFSELENLSDNPKVEDRPELHFFRRVRLRINKGIHIAPETLAQKFCDRLLEIDPLSAAQLNGSQVSFFGGDAEFFTVTSGRPPGQKVSSRANFDFTLSDFLTIAPAIQLTVGILEAEDVKFHLDLEAGILIQEDPSHFSSLLRGSEVRMEIRSANSVLCYGNLTFSMSNPANLLSISLADARIAPSACELQELLRILIKRGVVYTENYYGADE